MNASICIIRNPSIFTIGNPGMFITRHPNSNIGNYLGFCMKSLAVLRALRGVRRGFGFRVEGSAALAEQYLVELATWNQLEYGKVPTHPENPKTLGNDTYYHCKQLSLQLSLQPWALNPKP